MKTIDYEAIMKSTPNLVGGVMEMGIYPEVELAMKQAVSQGIDIVLEEVVGENIISDEEENNFVKIQQMLKERLCK